MRYVVNWNTFVFTEFPSTGLSNLKFWLIHALKFNFSSLFCRGGGIISNCRQFVGFCLLHTSFSIHRILFREAYMYVQKKWSGDLFDAATFSHSSCKIYRIQNSVYLCTSFAVCYHMVNKVSLHVSFLLHFISCCTFSHKNQTTHPFWRILTCLSNSPKTSL